MRQGTLLYDEPPLCFSPSLAILIGVSEAIFLQQLHYWVVRSKHIIEGKRWVYNSISDWRRQFPFWSESKIKRIIKKLKDEELIFVGRFNRKSFDKTNWYTINYEKIKELTHRLGQNDPIVSITLHQPITETTTDTTNNNLYNIAKDACVLEEEKNKKEKIADSNNETENKTREVCGGEKTQTLSDLRVKELKKLMAKIYAIKYQETTGLKYPSSDYGKLMKLAEKAAKYFLRQYQEGIIKTPENIIYRVLVLINFAFIRKKTDPAYIFGKIAESYAELKTYSQDERPFYKKQVERALEQANQMEEEILQVSQDFLKLFKEE